jgi:hypothetical protein
MSDLDSLSLNISKALKGKFPDIDNNHYSPNVIKSFITKSKINYKVQSEIQRVINTLTNTLTSYRIKTNKEKQTLGIVDFDSQPYIHQPTNRQKLVQREPIKTVKQDSSKREFLNSKPLIVDAGMVANKQMPNVYLNQLETNNSLPTNFNLINNFPSGLPTTLPNNLPDELTNNEPEFNNNTDRYILTDRERNMISEETSEWSHYLIIDSKDRDFKAFPDPNFYTIKFSPPGFNSDNARPGFVDKIFSNVKSIELIRCCILDTSNEPDSSDTSNNSPPYIILEVEEFDTQNNGTNQHLNKSLTILDTFNIQDKFKYFNPLSDTKIISKFNPRATIDKMTFRFKLPDGSLYNFGVNNKTKTTTVNYMLFKITVLQKTIETSFVNKS